MAGNRLKLQNTVDEDNFVLTCCSIAYMYNLKTFMENHNIHEHNLRFSKITKSQ